MPDSLRRALGAAVLLLVAVAGAAAAQPDPRYWRLDDVIAQLEAWAQARSDIVHLTSLGTSGQGEAIPLVRISDNAAAREPEPAVFFHAAQHANECNGTTAIMMQMATLIAGYGQDPAITAQVDGLEIYFAPVRNPDGHRYAFGDDPSAPDWRKTLRDNNGNGEVDFPLDGVDTNRNWNWRWDESEETDPASQKYKGPFPWSEPEVTAARDFILDRKPVFVVDYHSPVTIGWANYVFYPFMRQPGGAPPDFDLAREIAQEWAGATQTMGGGVFGTVFAYDTLPKEQCWVYGNTGILAYLMEIGDHCWYTGAAVDTIGARVARGSRVLLDRALEGPGLTGRVTDARTGQPLVAEVRLLELHDPGIGPRHTDRDFGQFFRPTFPGAYTLQVLLEGYETRTLPVVAGASGWTEQDVALEPITTAAADLIADAPWLQMGASLRGDHRVRLSLPAGLPAARVDLFDPRGRRVAVLGENLAAGRPHALALPAHLADGVYLLRAAAGGRQQVARFVFLD